jgi:hypothetical protein
LFHTQLLLELRRQLERWQVLKDDVISDCEAAPYRCFVVAENIPGKPDAWREIIDVLFGHAEEKWWQSGIRGILQVSHGVDSLFIIVTGVCDEFIAKAKV